MSSPFVSQEILKQLGGNKFIVMTGVSNLVYDDYSLMMTLPKNKSKANRLKIKLEPTDTYTMTFFKYTGPRKKKNSFEYTEPKSEEIVKYEDVYCDSLQELFTEVTGMYTHL